MVARTANIASRAYDEGLRKFMINMYNHTALGLAVSGFIAYIVFTTGMVYSMGGLMWLFMFAPCGKKKSTTGDGLQKKTGENPAFHFHFPFSFFLSQSFFWGPTGAHTGRAGGLEATTTRRAAPRKGADMCRGDARGCAAPGRRVMAPQSARLTPPHRVGGVVVLQ